MCLFHAQRFTRGPEYFGLYTLVEEVDGEVLDTQFASDDGNLYNPETSTLTWIPWGNNEALQQSVMIEPVHSGHRGVLNFIQVTPRVKLTDEFCFDNPMIVSANAMSYESPTLPTEAVMPTSDRRSLYLIDTY